MLLRIIELEFQSYVIQGISNQVIISTVKNVGFVATIMFIIQWNLPIANIPNSGHAINSDKTFSSKCDNLF